MRVPLTSATATAAPSFGRVAWAALVVFLANAALLVLQLVAGRLLAPFIGSSLETWTAVIGVFLLGISLGNWLGGRLGSEAMGLTAAWLVATSPTVLGHAMNAMTDA